MPRGIKARPIVEVWVGMLYDIPFELVVDGALLPPASGRIVTVTAEYNGAVKFQAILVDVSGGWVMEASDLFDEKGDWDAVVKIEEDAGAIVYFAELFIFRVQDPGGVS